MFFSQIIKICCWESVVSACNEGFSETFPQALEVFDSRSPDSAHCEFFFMGVTQIHRVHRLPKDPRSTEIQYSPSTIPIVMLERVDRHFREGNGERVTTCRIQFFLKKSKLKFPFLLNNNNKP